MPAELLDEIIRKDAQGKLQGIGVYVYKNGRLYKKTDGKAFRSKLTIEDKFVLMDTMLMKALYA